MRLRDLVTIGAVLALAGCATSPGSWVGNELQVRETLHGRVVELDLRDPDRERAKSAAADVLVLIEDELARMAASGARSEIARLNAAPPGTWVDLTPEVGGALMWAARAVRESAGAADPSIQQIEAEANPHRARRKTAGVALDLGLFADASIADGAAGELIRAGVPAARVTIHGQSATYGGGVRPWRVPLFDASGRIAARVEPDPQGFSNCGPHHQTRIASKGWSFLGAAGQHAKWAAGACLALFARGDDDLSWAEWPADLVGEYVNGARVGASVLRPQWNKGFAARPGAPAEPGPGFSGCTGFLDALDVCEPHRCVAVSPMLGELELEIVRARGEFCEVIERTNGVPFDCSYDESQRALRATQLEDLLERGSLKISYDSDRPGPLEGACEVGDDTPN